MKNILLLYSDMNSDSQRIGECVYDLLIRQRITRVADIIM